LNKLLIPSTILCRWLQRSTELTPKSNGQNADKENRPRRSLFQGEYPVSDGMEWLSNIVIARIDADNQINN
jgi:hypothetical protein